VFLCLFCCQPARTPENAHFFPIVLVGCGKPIDLLRDKLPLSFFVSCFVVLLFAVSREAPYLLPPRARRGMRLSALAFSFIDRAPFLGSVRRVPRAVRIGSVQSKNPSPLSLPVQRKCLLLSRLTFAKSSPALSDHRALTARVFRVVFIEVPTVIGQGGRFPVLYLPYEFPYSTARVGTTLFRFTSFLSARG